jgi:hypothetical protein
MKFLFATALAACASAQTTLGNNFFGYGNNLGYGNTLGYGYGNTLGYGFGNTLGYAAAPVATTAAATTAAAPATTTVAAPAVATNFGYGNTLGYGNTFGYGNTLGWNYGNTLGATTTTPLYTRAATTATTVAAPAATTVAAPVAAATNYAFGNTLGNFGGYSFPYYGGYGGWAAPVVQTCEAKAQSGWNFQNDFKTEAKKLYDGRTISWVQYPKPETVTNRAEFEQSIDNWSLVANWKAKTHNARRLGNEVHFEVSWTGSKSNINGYVTPADVPSTYHIYNCATNSEKVYADYGGIVAAMGAGQ